MGRPIERAVPGRCAVSRVWLPGSNCPGRLPPAMKMIGSLLAPSGPGAPGETSSKIVVRPAPSVVGPV